MSGLASTPSRRGREIAQLFRQSRALGNVRACDIDAILDEAQVEVTSSESSDPGYAAVLIRLHGGGAGVMMAADQGQGRRRFSLAHELGHFFIPSHATAGPALKCADADLRARSSDAQQREWEANDFAAELLMPKKLFSGDLRHRSISFDTVEYLAGDDMYKVSRTAAAWRLVQITREPCALVMSAAGAIKWVARSESFRHWIPERGQPVGKGSIVAAVNRGESSALSAERVAPYEWLENVSAGSIDMIEVFESTHPIPSRGEIMSLIWVRERGEQGFDDDDLGG